MHDERSVLLGRLGLTALSDAVSSCAEEPFVQDTIMPLASCCPVSDGREFPWDGQALRSDASSLVASVGEVELG